MEAIKTQLEPIRQALQADGYDLEVEELGAGQLQLSVTAGPDACEECLIPKEMMKGMIAASLGARDGVKEIKLRYPGE